MCRLEASPSSSSELACQSDEGRAQVVLGSKAGCCVIAASMVESSRLADKGGGRAHGVSFHIIKSVGSF